MIACGIQKLSDAQMKKLHKGLPVRVKSGSAHELPMSPAQAKKLAKAKANNKGMILSYPNVGGSLWGDAKNWYKTNIPAKYREPIEQLALMGAKDAGIIEGSGGRGRGLVPNIQQLVDAQNQLAVYNPVKPIRGKGALSILAKHPVAGRHHLVRHHLAGAGRRGKGMHGKGWKEDLEAFNQWTGAIGDKLVNIGRTVDPEGKLQKALINRATDEIDPSAKTARIASQTIGNLVGKTPSQDEATSYAPAEMLANYAFNQKKSKVNKPRKPQGKKKQPSAVATVTATEVLPSEYNKNEKVLTAYTQPLPVASIASAFEDQVPYQRVNWFGSGAKKGGAVAKKPHLVKGSLAAKEHMARLRALRSGNMSGTALRPAGY